MMDINIQPFKEPRGFIKLLQWLFAICAFATTVDYSGKYSFIIKCNAVNLTTTARGVAEYPFNMDKQEAKFEPIQGCTTPTIQLVGSAQSEAVFFVFTGVISFIYATVMIAVYLFVDKIYLSNRRAPLVDFFITVMIAVFWIAGASAWAHGISIVGQSMDGTEWLKQRCPADHTCTNPLHDSTSKLVISVLFGFINFVLWSGNIWFLYKETAALLNGSMMGTPPPNTQTQGPQP